MSYFKRIMYLDHYCGGEKRQNVGFVKWMQWKRASEKNEESDYFQICLSEAICEEEQDCIVQIAGGLCGDEKTAESSVRLGKVTLKRGRGMLTVSNVYERIGDGSLDGEGNVRLMLLLGQDAYAGCMLKEVKRDAVRKEVADENAMKENIVKEDVVKEDVVKGDVVREGVEISAAEQEENAQKGSEEARMEQMDADKWMQLWKTGKHIRPFGDEREYLQMDLKTMVVLGQQYYPMVENSFLLHGYYNYGHLAMVKMIRQGRERICLGVPGNYYRKEAEVAVMFGFESFESETEPPKEGEFGYYFIGVGL